MVTKIRDRKKDNNVLPFSPLSEDEEAIVDAYLAPRRRPASDRTTANPLRRSDVASSAVVDDPVKVGTIIGKYSGWSLLPNWSMFNENEEVEWSRPFDDAARKDRRLFSIVIFEINWADSGPGISWPEQYPNRVTPAPAWPLPKAGQSAK